MTDLELQKKCHDAGLEYVKLMWPDLEDVEKKAYLMNACAAGYGRGYKQAIEETAQKEAT